MRACFESVERMDGELAGLARGAGKLRYALGAGLEALGRVGGHHDLGFSSVEAYALERCERRARWIQESRGLARRLARLPALRHALETGAIGFSMAQVLAKVAGPEDERAWLADARTRTVRQMQELVAVQRSDVAPESGEGSALRTLTVTVDQEDAWLLECARMIVGHVAGPTMEDTVEALLGEGTTSLLETIGGCPSGSGGGADFRLLEDEPEDTRQREWEAQRARWREEAEERCERRILAEAGDGMGDATAIDGDATDIVGDAAPFGRSATASGDATAIDAELRRVAFDLAVRDLEIGRIAEAFWKADGWRRLGYATDAQYARERLGTSLSWVKGKRTLARRVAALPQLGRAIRSGLLGYEAACLVASVATPVTVEAWTERAHERTVKHLREEVSAVQMFARLGATSASSDPWPPSEETMEEVAALESRIVSGAVFRDAFESDQGPAGSPGPEPPCFTRLSAAVAGMLERLERREGPRWMGRAGAEGGRRLLSAGFPGSSAAGSALFGAPRPSREDRARGRVTLRLRVSAGTMHYYRWLERLFGRHGPRHVSFLRFLSASLVETWRHSLGSSGAYAEVYARDRYRCTSPVCTRRDVTPHHLRLRSAGGDDAMKNLTSLCVWCHLEGVHGGRLRGTPPADHVTWSLGRRRHEHTVVHGRRRGAAPGRRSLAAQAA